ncbi:MAG: hypothetical protein DMD26_14575 [Gemmatimonadetes bacterium]|nr:MAG: hypothetical protein DMD26_14575 [Gemmatimonadota bacterium]
MDLTILACANGSAQSVLASRPSVSLSADAFFLDLGTRAWHQWLSPAESLHRVRRQSDRRPSDATVSRNDVSYSAALGARVWLREHTGMRAEFRLRGVGEGFTGSAAEVTLGVAWR